MKWFYIAAAVCTLALVLSPLLFLPGETKPSPKTARMISYGSYEAEVKSLDPATCGDTTSSSIQANFYEGLYAYHYLKRPAEVVPALAAGMPTISDDGLTYTIRIKPDLRYSRNACFGLEADGTPKTRAVRADDFILSYKRAADYYIDTGLAWAFLSDRIVGLDDWRKQSQGYKAGDFSRYGEPVEGLRALDDLTLQIKLTEKFPQMIYVLAMSVYAPTPIEAVEYWLGTQDNGHGGREPTPMEKRERVFREPWQVVGTGPYVLAAYERKNKIILLRNPEFRDEKYPTEGAPGDEEAGLLKDAGKKVPFIDEQRLDYVAEDYSMWMRFLTKQTDVGGIPKETFESIITPDKQLAEKWRQRRIHLVRYTSPAVYWVVFNVEDPVVGKSKSLREALCLAFDVKTYIKVLHNGRGEPAVNILPNTFKAWKEAGPGPYYRFDLPEAKKKIELARKELEAAGALDNGQIPELKLDIPGRDATSYRMGEYFQQQFAAVGVRLKPVYLDWPALQEKVDNKQTQMYTMGWVADYPDAENFLQLFYSKNIAKGTNNSNYSNPEFDKLYEKIRTMEDTPERTDIYARMVRMISEDCPVLMLSEPENYVLFYDWMENYKPHPFGYGFTKYQRIDVPLRNELGGR
jgi:ABC-type transport system substrate-binding protein